MTTERGPLNRSDDARFQTSIPIIIRAALVGLETHPRNQSGIRRGIRQSGHTDRVRGGADTSARPVDGWSRSKDGWNVFDTLVILLSR